MAAVQASLSQAVRAATHRALAARERLLADYPHWEDWRRQVRTTKTRVMERWQEYVDLLREKVEAWGGNVYLAKDAAATLGLVFVPGLWGAWVLFALGGLFVACFWPSLLAVASDHICIGSMSLFSLLAAAGVSGCVVVPWAIGALGDIFGLRTGMLVLPTAMGMLIVMLLVASRYMRSNCEPGQQ